MYYISVIFWSNTSEMGFKLNMWTSEKKVIPVNNIIIVGYNKNSCKSSFWARSILTATLSWKSKFRIRIRQFFFEWYYYWLGRNFVLFYSTFFFTRGARATRCCNYLIIIIVSNRQHTFTDTHWTRHPIRFKTQRKTEGFSYFHALWLKNW